MNIYSSAVGPDPIKALHVLLEKSKIKEDSRLTFLKDIEFFEMVSDFEIRLTLSGNYQAASGELLYFAIQHKLMFVSAFAGNNVMYINLIQGYKKRK